MESTASISKPVYKNLVLSGGSVKGIAHVGAIKKLVDEGWIDLAKLKSIAGTSVGSLFGVLITLGFTIDEVWDFIYNIDLKKLIQPDILMFLDKCGVEDGNVVYRLVEEILAKKTGIVHINFAQLYKITGIHFIVVGSCLTTKEIVYYDHINTPDFKVSMAIRISISIPCFFVPVEIDGMKYIDGGVLNNFPMNIFRGDKMDETVGVLISNEFDTAYTYPEEYFMAIINLFMYHYYQKTADQYYDNTIYVNDKSINVNIVSFGIDSSIKKRLYESGIRATEMFIKRKATMPNKNMIDPIDNIIAKTIEMATNRDVHKIIEGDF